MKYTVVIPAFNEGDVIEKVLEPLKKLENLEIIVIDDGSSDDTAEKARAMGVRVISHPVNRGYGAALKTGMKAAETEFVATYDGDGQHRLEDIKKLMEIAPDYDMVVGARGKDSHRPLMRRPGKAVLAWLVNMLSKRKIPDFNSGLRVFRTAVIRKYLHLMPDGFSLSTTSTVALNSMGYGVKYVPIQVLKREGRKSSVKMARDGMRTIMLIINLTVLFNPMRIFLPVSFVCFALSFLYFVLYAFLIRIHVTASMTLLFVTGMLIFFLGIVCEQISAIRREINQDA
ncbi:MAG: glycosyltransferase family 2 protein [Bernardetiaceae bacterium]|nr:glycosyltransferase family 2 protein [Bernardetiaceae bacterium]